MVFNLPNYIWPPSLKKLQRNCSTLMLLHQTTFCFHTWKRNSLQKKVVFWFRHSKLCDEDPPSGTETKESKLFWLLFSEPRLQPLSGVSYKNFLYGRQGGGDLAVLCTTHKQLVPFYTHLYILNYSKYSLMINVSCLENVAIGLLW